MFFTGNPNPHPKTNATTPTTSPFNITGLPESKVQTPAPRPANVQT